MTRTSRDAAAFLSGVFLLCMSVLMIQIVQTRMLSVISLYYMAFFSISMAMSGLTGTVRTQPAQPTELASSLASG